MTENWNPRETTTHQDHVIAHVIGATVLGYLIFDEALHILLDIGFVWTIFVDGQMNLLPHPVAVGELEIENTARTQIASDIDRLLARESDVELEKITRPRVECRITEVKFFSSDDRRRLVLTGEESNLAIETSVATAEIQVNEF